MLKITFEILKYFIFWLAVFSFLMAAWFWLNELSYGQEPEPCTGLKCYQEQMKSIESLVIEKYGTAEGHYRFTSGFVWFTPFPEKVTKSPFKDKTIAIPVRTPPKIK